MRRIELAPIVLIAVTFAAWAAGLRGTFQFDDIPNVVRDPATTEAAALWGRLATGIRPLLRLSYFLDHAVWGMRAPAFLAVNLLLHLATVLGVHALARHRLADPLAAIAAAALFALQPAHGETIAYVSGRSTGLMAALLVGALLAHEQARVAPGRAGPFRVVSLSLFALAVLAKEVALVFPALLAAWEWTRPSAGAEGPTEPGSRNAWRGIVLTGVGAGILLAVLALSTRYRDLAAYSLDLRGPLASLAVNAVAIPVMVSLWIRPGALTVDHGFDAASVPPLEVVAGAASIVAALGLAIALRRRAPHASLALLWVLLALAPTQSLVAKLDPVTEKPLYLAWIGPSLAFGAACAFLRDRLAERQVRIAAAALAALLLSAAALCAARASVWSDPRRLWAEAAARGPDRSRPWNNLGAAHLQAGEQRAAWMAFRRALELNPADTKARSSLLFLEQTCRRECEDE